MNSSAVLMGIRITTFASAVLLFFFTFIDYFFLDIKWVFVYTLSVVVGKKGIK